MSSISRKPLSETPGVLREGLRVNESIDAPQVRLIGGDGANQGVMTLSEARSAATAAGLDLVEVVPVSDPPVCKLLDYGKYKYKTQKKASVARKKQKTIEVKEIKMRPNIDQHDYDVKIRNMRRFFEEGDKVKVTLRFRGREMVHQNLGRAVLDRVRGEIEGETAKVEQEPKMEGHQLVMILAPRAL